MEIRRCAGIHRSTTRWREMPCSAEPSGWVGVAAVVVGPGDVPMPGRGDPLQPTIGQRPDLPPTAGVLQMMVAGAEPGQVDVAGRAAVGEGDEVVEFAVDHLAPAGREPA